MIKRDIHPSDIGPSIAKGIQSNIYPLTITSYIGYQYYLNFMLSYLWFGFLMAGITTIILLSEHKKQSQRSLEYSLSSALKNKHLHVHMQPIVNRNTTEIVGCESLLRWNDPIEGEEISPAIFIPLAESLGLIEDLTYFVLREVLYTMKNHREVFESKYISVNISRNVVSTVTSPTKSLASIRRTQIFSNRWFLKSLRMVRVVPMRIWSKSKTT